MYLISSVWYNFFMELSEIYADNYSTKQQKVNFSLEIFPPANGDISKLFEELRVLKKYNPCLVSLTFGAGGGLNRFSSADLKSMRDLELNLMPHFTCVSMLKQEIEQYIRMIENLGLENILALRGDIPDYIKIQDLDFKHANELVEFIHEKTTLSIGVAGYPQGHPESSSIEEDLINLKKKTEAGASAIFTQMFFDNNLFYDYIEKVQNIGINLPVIAGIMPIRNLKQINKMMAVTRVTLPKKLLKRLEEFPDDAKQIGTEYCIEQCLDLIEQKVDGLHFFTLNHSDQASEILENIL